MSSPPSLPGSEEERRQVLVGGERGQEVAVEHGDRPPAAVACPDRMRRGPLPLEREPDDDVPGPALAHRGQLLEHLAVVVVRVGFLPGPAVQPDQPEVVASTRSIALDVDLRVRLEPGEHVEGERPDRAVGAAVLPGEAVQHRRLVTRDPQQVPVADDGGQVRPVGLRQLRSRSGGAPGGPAPCPSPSPATTPPVRDVRGAAPTPGASPRCHRGGMTCR